MGPGASAPAAPISSAPTAIQPNGDASAAPICPPADSSASDTPPSLNLRRKRARNPPRRREQRRNPADPTPAVLAQLALLRPPAPPDDQRARRGHQSRRQIDAAAQPGNRCLPRRFQRRGRQCRPRPRRHAQRAPPAGPKSGCDVESSRAPDGRAPPSPGSRRPRPSICRCVVPLRSLRCVPKSPAGSDDQSLRPQPPLAPP